MTQQDVNLYYRLNAQSVPEAFPDFYQGSLVEGGGCKALHVSLSALAHRLPPLWTTCCLHESLQLHQFCACLKPAQSASSADLTVDNLVYRLHSCTQAAHE